ncbi:MULTISPECIES: GNAT family N-acetyltransferase [Legionella]|uniref:GNAT family N-acetyltransferase n=1 Tax=Legionella TaxID=445 RepID=UPI000F8EEFFF|nr:MULTISPECIES: GNAT family N-acetyltransferase [Legionella]MCP0912873.1 GNAT family N-acetyltransferase [Legionella sp. 27cVA30]RUR09463.1 GNAT family N-acetyltransferase [Legionella septentrionalis]
MSIKKIQNRLQIQPAEIKDYLTIQNMAGFYIYDLSRECGWACSDDGLYESFDFKAYLTEPTRKAFLVRAADELAGFILLNQQGFYPETTWNMSEFFILAKFQGKGIGSLAAAQIWQMHQGAWEISVLPENQRALSFWRKTISNFTGGSYYEELKHVDYDPSQPKRIIFCFNTNAHQEQNVLCKLNDCKIQLIDKIAAATEKRMMKDLVAYETSHGIDVNYQRFAITISNEDDIIFGVLHAYTAFAEIYVDDIWIDSAYRHQGYGRQLLVALENHFKGQGFNNINLVTSAFQAPEFYKKCGFQAEFTRINKKNPKLSKTFFVKFFNEKEETQGIVK